MKRLLLLVPAASLCACTSTKAIKQEMEPLAERMGVLENRLADLSSKLEQSTRQTAAEVGKDAAAGAGEAKAETGGWKEKLGKLLPGNRDKKLSPEEAAARLDVAVKRLEAAVEEMKKHCAGR